MVGEIARQRGFSLVDVIVAMALAMAMGFVLVPKVSGLYAEYQLMSATNQLGFEIIRGHLQAVGQNRYVRIRMVSATEYMREKSTDGTTWSIEGPLLTLPRGITTTTATAMVRFDRRGYATLNNSVVLNNGIGQARTILTSPIGRVTIA
jgi:Tfp pilus assembly protein FimT